MKYCTTNILVKIEEAKIEEAIAIARPTLKCIFNGESLLKVQ